MKRFYSTLLFMCLCINAALAQKYSVSGTVTDGTQQETLPGAAVVLLNPKDSTQVTGVTTGVNGQFNVKVSKAGSYLLRVSYIGYITQYRNVTLSRKAPAATLDSIVLQEDAKMMKEATVTAKMSQMEMKGDTFQYNAEAFRVPEGSALEALVKKLPGAEVGEDGTVKINGKTVKKIMMEGKEFFEGDTKMAMKNLSSNMVKSIKAYDKQSDYSRITGIDDGEEETVLDLTVKKGMKEGWTADIDLGGGTEDRYNAQANLHRITDQLQFSLMGSRGNTNRGGWGGNGDQTNTRGGANVNWQNGKKEGDAGYFEVGGSVRYDGNRNSTLTTSNSQMFLTETTSTFSNNKNQGLSHSDNVNVRMRLEWNPDSMTTITFRPNFSHSQGDNMSNNQSVTFNSDPYEAGMTNPLDEYRDFNDVNNIRVNANDRYSLSDNNRNNAGGRFQVNRRLNNKGRNITLDLNGDYSKSDNSSNSISLVNYFQDGRANNDTYQRNTSPSKNYSYQGRLSYSEPLFEGANLQVSYQLQRRFQDQNRTVLTYQDLANELEKLGMTDYSAEDLYTGYLSGVDASLLVKDLQNSQYATYKELNHNANVMFRYNKKFENEQTLRVNAGVSFQPQTTHMDYQRSNIDTTITRQTNNWAPTFNFRWKISNTSQLNLRYNGSMSQPSMTNLVEVIDNSDPLNISTGNAGLKSSWGDRVMLFYNGYNPEAQRGWGTFMSFNTTRRSISNATIYDTETGARYSRPMNIDGNWNTNANVFFNTAIGTKKLFNLSSRTGVNYSNNVGYLSSDLTGVNLNDYIENGIVDMNGLFSHVTLNQSITKNTNWNQNLKLNYRNELGVNEDWSIDVGVEGNVYYSHARNNVQTNANLDTWTFHYGGNFMLVTPFNLSLSTDIRQESRRGFEDASMNTDELIWNAQLSQNLKQWLKGHDLSIAVEWYDILQQRSNISRNISATMRSDTYTNAINSYVMLHLRYRLKLMGDREARREMGPGFNGFGGPGGGRGPGGGGRGRM